MAKSLDLKIKIEIIGADIVIEDADISLVIKKTNEVMPNYCTCTIYNLADDTYNKINNKALGARIYIDKAESGYILIFEGDLRDLKKYRKSKSKTSSKKSKQNFNTPPVRTDSSNADIETVIELQDGIKTSFLDAYFSKSYSGTLTNTQVINDCLSFLRNKGVPVGRVDTLYERTFSNGKIYNGSTIGILRGLCSNAGGSLSIQNNIVSIINNAINKIESSIVLDGNTCQRPEEDTNKETNVNAPLLPYINPNNLIQLDFKTVNGLYEVKKIKHKVNNFGGVPESELVLKKSL